jgi:hypothetical protein
VQCLNPAQFLRVRLEPIRLEGRTHKYPLFVLDCSISKFCSFDYRRRNCRFPWFVRMKQANAIVPVPFSAIVAEAEPAGFE